MICRWECCCGECTASAAALDLSEKRSGKLTGGVRKASAIPCQIEAPSMFNLTQRSPMSTAARTATRKSLTMTRSKWQKSRPRQEEKFCWRKSDCKLISKRMNLQYSGPCCGFPALHERHPLKWLLHGRWGLQSCFPAAPQSVASSCSWSLLFLDWSALQYIHDCAKFPKQSWDSMHRACIPHW